jgi:hypothetical protein
MYIYYTREGERMMRDGMMRDEREGRGERNKANTSLYGTYNTPHVLHMYIYVEGRPSLKHALPFPFASRLLAGSMYALRSSSFNLFCACTCNITCNYTCHTCGQGITMHVYTLVTAVWLPSWMMAI